MSVATGIPLSETRSHCSISGAVIDMRKRRNVYDVYAKRKLTSAPLEDLTDSWSPAGAAQAGLQSTGLVHRNTTEQRNSCSHHGSSDPLQFDVVSGSPLPHNRCFQRLSAAPPGQELTRTDSNYSNYAEIAAQLSRVILKCCLC